jgi:hypothetical protein
MYDLQYQDHVSFYTLSPSEFNTIRGVLSEKACSSGVLYTLIPANVFGNEIIPQFRREFMHWYDKVNHCVKHRPKEQP